MNKSETTLNNSNSDRKDALPRISEIAGIIGAVGGVFVVLLWLAGRNYARGYFSAMNIPAFHVSFSVWEYAEVSWLPLFLYTIITIALSTLILGIIFALINPLFVKFARWLLAKIKKPGDKTYDGMRLPAGKLFFATYLAFIGFLLILVINASLQFVYGFGQTEGRRIVLDGSYKVQIISEKPLALGTPTIISSTADLSALNLFLYDNLWLLTYNDGKYYIFREIDPISCTPKQVFVIGDNQNVQVNILPLSSPSSSANCHLGK